MKESNLTVISRLSVHGLQLLGRSIAKTKPLRIALLTLVLLAAVLLGLQLKRVVEYYLEYPTQVDFRIVTADSMDFPAVTFCSLGIVNKDIVRKIPVFKEMGKVMNGFNNTTGSSRKKREDENNQSTLDLSLNQELLIQNFTKVANYDYENSSKPYVGRANGVSVPHNPFSSFVRRRKLHPNTDVHLSHTNECDEKTELSNIQEQFFASEVRDLLVGVVDDSVNFTESTTVAKSNALETSGLTISSEETVNVAESALTVMTDPALRRMKRFGTSPNLCSAWCMPVMSPPTRPTTVAACQALCVPPGCLSVSYCAFCQSVGSDSCRLYDFNCCTSPTKTAPVSLCDDVAWFYAVCTSQFSVATGAISSSGPYVENFSYTFTCNPGTMINPSLAATAVYTCSVSGTWDKPFTPCTAFCNDIFAGAANGIVNIGPTYWTGSAVSFTCNTNYQTAAQLSVTQYSCNSNTWSPVFQPCQALCSDIFVTATGAPNIQPPYWSSTSVTFNCSTSYFAVSGQAISSKLYTCVGTAWSPAAFTPCLPHCTTLFNATTGTMSGAAPYPDSTKILFTCKTNYLTNDELNADNYTCATTTWNKVFSPCIPTCQNIFYTTGNTTTGPPYMGRPTTYLFACMFQYLTITKTRNSSYVCQSDATWNRPFQTCIMECSQIHRSQSSIEIADSEPLIETFMPSGSNSTFSCIDGFSIRLPNNTAKTNCYNGTWDLQPNGYPSCLQNCDVLDTKQFYPRLLVSYDSNNKTSVCSGTIASFTCNNSYFMYGDYNFTTCVNGSWDVSYKDLPICLEEAVPFYPASFLQDVQDDTRRNDSLAAGASLADMIAYIWANMSDSMKYSLGFGKGDNVLGCTFDGRPCDSDKEIHGIQEPSLGNCYTFNHEFMNPLLQTSQLGEKHGLHWIFDTKQEDFLSVIATAGIKLIIHQQKEPLFVDAMGIVVSPGYLYNIRIRKESEMRVFTPKSQCYDSPSQPKYYYYTNRTYQIEGCVRSYFQYLLMGHCHCASPHYPSANTNIRPCTLEDRLCADRFLKNVTDLQTSVALEMCPQPCMGTIERRVVTITINVEYDPALVKHNLTTTYIRQNLVGINVFYDSLEYKTYYEYQTYLFLNLATDIGASVGLLLGMSAISIIEMIVLPFKLLWNNYRTPK